MTQSVPAQYVVAIDHVGIAVADLDAAVAWYADHLGAVETHREVNAEQGVAEAMLGYPGSPSKLQVLAPLTPESTIAKFLDRSGPGLQQLAFTVTDIHAVSDYLRDKGVRLLYDVPRRGTADSQINFIHPKDAGGVLVELVQPVGEQAH